MVIDVVEVVVSLARAFVAGEPSVPEASLHTAAAAKATASARDDEELTETGMIMGAETVTRIPQVETVFYAGTDFVIFPGFSRWVIQHTLSIGMLPLPGVSSATSLMIVVDAGAISINTFLAAASDDSAVIRAPSVPFGSMYFVPADDVSTGSVAECLAVPSVAAVGTSRVIPHRLVKAQDQVGIARIAQTAVTLVGAVQKIRGIADVGVGASTDVGAFAASTYNGDAASQLRGFGGARLAEPALRHGNDASISPDRGDSPVSRDFVDPLDLRGDLPSVARAYVRPHDK